MTVRHQTIAHAVENLGIAIIDEKKAYRFAAKIPLPTYWK